MFARVMVITGLVFFVAWLGPSDPNVSGHGTLLLIAAARSEEHTV